MYAFYIATFFLVLMGSVAGLADVVPSKDRFISSGWRISTGLQGGRQTVDIHSDGINPSRTLKSDNTKRSQDVLFSPSVMLEYRGKHSAMELTYTRDCAATTLMTRINSISNTIYGDFGSADIKTDALKFSYTRSLFQSDSWQYGISANVQALFFSVITENDVSDYIDKSYVAPVPSAGVYAQYKPTDRFTCKLDADYLPLIVWKGYRVKAGNVNFSTEYQLNSTFFAGIGARYSFKELGRKTEKYNVNLSLPATAGAAYIGLTF